MRRSAMVIDRFLIEKSIGVKMNDLDFLPARRYASAGNSDRNVSVRPSGRHAPVLYQNGSPKTLVF